MIISLEEALSEAKAGNSRNWGGIDLKPLVSGTILQAAASGDLIPLADHKLAVALAYQRAAQACDDLLEVPPGKPSRCAAAILALAPADALAEVAALRAMLQVAEANTSLNASISAANLARAETAEADNQGLRNQIGKLLRILDDWDKARADECNGGLTMHTYGQTPDWYVEAAFWCCYGYSPDDPRAALQPKAAT